MNYSELLEELSIEDLPNEGLRLLATDCGKEVVIRLLQGVPGQSFIVPERAKQHLPQINSAPEDARLDLLEELTSESWRLVAEICGVDVVLSLFEKAGGATFYVPKSGLKTVYKPFIVKHFNGHNAKRLALLLRISVSHIYVILNEKMGPVKRQKPVSENQMNIFRFGTDKRG